MKAKYYMLTLFQLASFLKVEGQISEEYNKFLVDTSYTEWKEYKFSPNSYENETYISEVTIKDLKTKTVVEKSFDYYEGLTMWTILKYDENWRIKEEISLHPDSTIEYIEKFNYKNGQVSSQFFDTKGNIDTTTTYTYLPNGKVLNFKFIVPRTSDSFTVNEYKYTYDEDTLLRKLELIEKEHNDTVHYAYAKYFYNSDNLRDTMISYDVDDKIVEKSVITYKGTNIDSIESSGKNGLNYFEKYFFNQTKDNRQIVIVGYTDNYGYLKRIEIK